MSHSGQATLRHHLPDLAERAKTMTGAQLARHYGIGHQTISRHLKRSGLVARKCAPTVDELPGIEGLAKTMHIAALARHYGISSKKMAYRLRVLGITAAQKPGSAGTFKQQAVEKYADLVDRAKEMHLSALARHYGVTPPTMSKALRNRGLVASAPPKYIPRPNIKRANHKLIPHATPFVDRRVKSTADMAMERLQRECPVFHCTADGKADAKGKFYRRGSRVMTGDEVIAMAERKGWRADAWRMVV